MEQLGIVRPIGSCARSSRAAIAARAPQRRSSILTRNCRAWRLKSASSVIVLPSQRAPRRHARRAWRRTMRVASAASRIFLRIFQRIQNLQTCHKHSERAARSRHSMDASRLARSCQHTKARRRRTQLPSLRACSIAAQALDARAHVRQVRCHASRRKYAASNEWCNASAAMRVSHRVTARRKHVSMAYSQARNLFCAAWSVARRWRQPSACALAVRIASLAASARDVHDPRSRASCQILMAKRHVRRRIACQAADALRASSAPKTLLPHAGMETKQGAVSCRLSVCRIVGARARGRRILCG